MRIVTTSSADPTPLFHVAESITRGGTTSEVLEYRPLALAEQLYTLDRAGVRLRQLRIRLSDDAVRTEPGAVQFLKGHAQMESNTGQGGEFGGLRELG